MDNNIDEKSTPSTQDVRMALLDNGYTPLANVHKTCMLKGWPSLVVDEDQITRWERSRGYPATGLRVENGLCVIDIDVDHAIVGKVVDAMLDTLPRDLEPERLERAGKGHKLAWFCQGADMFSRLHTRRWVAPGEVEDDGTHSIEIFGGGSPRQFGAFGPHSFNDDGSVAVAYRWAEESPADVPLADLAVLTRDQLNDMLDAAEGELIKADFTPVLRSARGEGTPGKVHDLTADMTFDILGGGTVSFAELSDMVRGGFEGRCSASWLEGPSASNRSRCLVTKSGGGHVSIWESAGGATHMAADLAPTVYTERVDRVAEKLRERQEKRRARLTADDDHVSGAAKLLLSYAFQPNSRTPVVPLWSGTAEQPMPLSGLREACRPYCGVEAGPRGGEKKVSPVDVWLANPNRVVIEGTQMRPGKERPTFEERGSTWVNTYAPPDLADASAGSSRVGVDFMTQLVPDPRERAWFMQWLAFKWRHPDIPGPGVIMVARDFGTGRGTFGALLRRMFGEWYVKDVAFKTFTGATYQSQYNEWSVSSLIAIVNESSASGNQSAYQAKHDVYEHLKEVVEPRPTMREVVVKGRDNYHATSCMSTLIMTNNTDAIPLPEDDRRFAVLTNGRKRDEEFWTALNAWMGNPANIAAFVEWLEAVDLEGYDPYGIPIMTRAKMAMVAGNESELDVAVARALGEMDGFFVMEQALKKIAEGDEELPDKWKAVAKKMITRQTERVRYPDGRERPFKIGGKAYMALTTDRDVGDDVNAIQVRRDIAKNGDVFKPNDIANLMRAGLKNVKKGTDE